VTAFIDLKGGDYGVEPICDALGVSASAYYQRNTGRRSERAVEDERLLELIVQTHKDNYFAYGYRKDVEDLVAGRRERAALPGATPDGRQRDPGGEAAWEAVAHNDP